MTQRPHSKLLPPEDEIHQLLDRGVKENPSNYPTVLLQIELARLISKFIGRLEGEIEDSVRRMGDSIDKK
jgi:hypothetical protein